MKSIHRWLTATLFFLVLFMGNQTEIHAADVNENISVTVPSSLNITFQADGTNAVSDFTIANESLVPVQITNVKVTEYNGWKLVPKQTTITVNQKKLAFELGGQSLYAGSNACSVSVPEKSQKALEVTVKRGAWNRSCSAEKAFAMEFEYEAGTKEFHLSFDGNGSSEPIETMGIQNGETISLPVPVRAKYKFLGWQDEEGNLHNEAFTMPIGDVTLTAQWQWMEAYAIYSTEDKSLTFVRSVEPITIGSVWQGKTVTNAYTGFEEAEYSSGTWPPWLWEGGVFGSDITTVTVLDVIQPKSTAYWFFCMHSVFSLELSQLDMSKAYSMTSMFSGTGTNVTGTFTVRGIGPWVISNMQYMNSAFRDMGANAEQFVMDDISHWDTSTVINMRYLFYGTALNSDWTLDCSGWDVSNVTNHAEFNSTVEDKVIPPKWVN